MNTERENLAAALLDVASGSRRNKTARLRECFDEIEAAKAAGASNKTIVATLEANGLFYDVPNLKNACSRIRKERALAEFTKGSMLIVPSKETSRVPLKSATSALSPTLNTATQTMQIKTTPHTKISTANHSAHDMNIKTNKPIQENNTDQNPIHELKVGKPNNGNTNLNATAVDTTKNTFTQKQDTSKYNTD